MTRMILSAMLAMVLVLTSQSMAVARGKSAATGQMVLCTGGGPLAVYVGAKGQPTSAPHICPNAALNVLIRNAHAAVNAPETIAWVETWPAAGALPLRVSGRSVPPSRAPPAAI